MTGTDQIGVRLSLNRFWGAEK